MNTRNFTLTDAPATTVSDEILDAVRDGAGYVHITPITGAASDVLITPATTVTFERIPILEPRSVSTHELWPEESWSDEYI